MKKEPTKSKKIIAKKKNIPVNPTKRCQTGIFGFDELVQGGFPRESSILICGGPGCGKTIFCMEFLINGWQKFNEKGLYVSFEQKKEALFNQANQFRWDLKNLDLQGNVKVMSIPINKIDKKSIEEIKEYVKNNKVERLVIDSLSTLIINAPIYTLNSELSIKDVIGENVIFSPPIIGDYIIKRFLYNFINEISELRTTNLLISEADPSGQYISRDTLSEFACDGVIVITFESLGGEFSRSLIVRKMRQTKNDEDIHPLEISKEGIKVHKIG
ncbi:MAG: ATPase domain-containing protein [Candidatus Pacearchaeota archaeon]